MLLTGFQFPSEQSSKRTWKMVALRQGLKKGLLLLWFHLWLTFLKKMKSEAMQFDLKQPRENETLQFGAGSSKGGRTPELPGAWRTRSPALGAEGTP